MADPVPRDAGADPPIDPQTLARLFSATEAAAGARTEAGDEDPVPAGPPLLIVGVPRSGTTWIAQTFARTAGAAYLHEPDNTGVCVYASAAKRGLGAYPYLRNGDAAPAYARCWDAAFAGARPPARWRTAATRRVERSVPPLERRTALNPDRRRLPARLRLLLALSSPPASPGDPGVRIVKSVHAALSLGWITARWNPRVLLVRRHPLDVVASWIEVEDNLELFLQDDDQMMTDRARHEIAARLGVPERPRGRDPVARAAWLIGLLTSELEDSVRSLPDAIVVDHELLCRDPVGELRFAARRCALGWTAAAEQFVAASQRPGRGYDLTRVAETVPGAWRQRLPPSDLRAARRELEQFAVSGRYDGLRDH